LTRKYTKVFGLKSLLPYFILILTFVFTSSSYSFSQESQLSDFKGPIIGAQRLPIYLDSLKGKRVAIVGNQTSVIKGTHLVDTLLSRGVQLVKVFSPEHGFRGSADAGELVDHSKDYKTGLQIISLYGNNKKPTAEQMQGIDIVVFDLQDVGVRFYTYLSTLHYVMEACAENKIPLLLLDRPNPNAHYVDGPVLENDQKSFVGMHPVPIVYGMTIGEYSLMINGERWLKDSLKCKLWVVPCERYVHKYPYSLPVAPSPNLRTDLAISLYPSLCLFEATSVSVGRGTSRPFEVFGHPSFKGTDFSFTPISCFGAKNPLYENVTCNGCDMKSNYAYRQYKLDLTFLINARKQLGDQQKFVTQSQFFNLLAGNAKLQEQLLNGVEEKVIRKSWEPQLNKFKSIRKKYLLYD